MNTSSKELMHRDMTLRDYFAVQIMGAIYLEFFNGVRNKEHGIEDADYLKGLALDAYRVADDMLLMRQYRETDKGWEIPVEDRWL